MPEEVKAEVDLTYKDDIALTVADYDLTKVGIIKSLPAEEVLKNYIIVRTNSLNKLYQHISQLKDIIKHREEAKRGK